MPRKPVLALLAFLLAIGAVSCERIEETQILEAKLSFTVAEFTDAIPLEYGELVSVTPLQEYQAMLWFKKSDDSIVAVRINVARGAIADGVLNIPRR